MGPSRAGQDDRAEDGTAFAETVVNSSWRAPWHSLTTILHGRASTISCPTESLVIFSRPPAENLVTPPAVRRLLLSLAPLVALSLFACGGDGGPVTGPGDGDGGDGEDEPATQLTAAPQGDTLTAIGGYVTISATTNDGRETTSPEVVPIEEARWLEEAAVLEEAALEEAIARGRAPGDAQLEVRAFGLADTITIAVVPDTVLVFARAGGDTVASGATVELRGYRMEELAADDIAVGDVGVGEGEPVDSATFRFSVPARRSTDECVGADRREVTVAGARVVGDALTLLDPREGTLALAPGEVRMLDADAAECLQLAAASAGDTAEYIAAYSDPSTLVRAEEPPTGAEGERFRNPTTFTVSALDRTDGTSSDEAAIRSSRARPDLDPTPSDHFLELDGQPARTIDGSLTPIDGRAAAAGDTSRGGVPCSDTNFAYPCRGFRARSAPWAVGDTFRMNVGDRENQARVFATANDGQIVLARFLPDDDLWSEAWEESARSAVERMTAPDGGIDYLRSVLRDTEVFTSPQNRQMLVVFANWPGDHFAAFASSGSGSHDPYVTTWMGIHLRMLDGTNPDRVFGVLAHEYAHAYNISYQELTRDPGTTAALPHTYLEEGTAEFLSDEIARRDLGLAFDGNHDVFDETITGTSFFGAGAVQRGNYTSGWDRATHLHRRLIQRRLQVSDETVLEAARAVVRGLEEGWFGHGNPLYPNHRRTGLVRRMRDVIEDFDPRVAVRRLMLAQMLDERGQKPVWSNVSFLRSGRNDDMDGPDVREWGWGRTAFGGTVAAGTGRGRTADRRYSSVGAFRLLDDRGGSFALTAEGSDVPVEWALYRLR